MDPAIWLLLAFLSAGIGNLLGFRIEHLACSAGYPRRWMKSLPYFLELLRFYRRVAPKKGWPLWYVPAFWLCGGLMFASAIAWVVLDSQLSEGDGPPEQLFWQLFPWFLTLGLVTNLILSFRLFTRLWVASGEQDLWTRLNKDDELRAQFLTVVSGWLGLVMAVGFYLLMKQAG